MMAAATMFAASCSDFDDYNEAYTSGNTESQQTLWDNISGNSELTQFSELLKKGGYDEVLKSSRFVTVWAPKDGTYDNTSLLAMDKETLVERFIKNHVANYNYNISTGDERRVYTLNEKSIIMENNTYGGLNIEKKNIPSVNGILHIIDGYAEYHPNIYEYIFESGSDSLASYFKHFEYLYFDESKSVIGPIDSLGQQTYSDSVIIKKNRLTDERTGLLNAELTNEDSVYTLLIPTDEAYKKSYDRIKSCYTYPSAGKIEYLPLTEDMVGQALPVTVQSEYVSDSLTRLRIAGNLPFTHTNKYNSWMPEVDNDNVWQSDTLCSTKWNLLSNGPEILSHTVGDVLKMSNGYVRIVDTLAVHPWESWCPEINVGIFSQDVRPLYSGCTPPTNFNVVGGTYGPDIQRYLLLDPVNDSSRPEMYFKLNNGVRSAAYNAYVVLLPEVYGESEENKITQFDVNFSYFGEGGKIVEKKFTKLITDSVNLGKVDTFHVGEIVFPYSYSATDAYPYLHLRINRNKYNSKEKNYTNRLKIAGIILRPVEYDEYLKNEE